MKMLNNAIGLAALIPLASIAVSCAPRTVEAAGEASLRVKTVRAETRPFTEDLASFGTVSYKTKNDVSALVEGTITRLRAKEGDAVRAGQTIADLRNVQLELQRDQAHNEITAAKAELNTLTPKRWDVRMGIENKLLSLESIDIQLRQKELELETAREKLANDGQLLKIGGITDIAYKAETVSVTSQESEIALMMNQRETAMLGLRDSDLLANDMVPSADEDKRKAQLVALNSLSLEAQIESAKSKLKAAENSLASVERLIEELTVRSPVAGIVGAKYYENGEFVKQNEKIFTIIDISSVTAVFSIQEQDIQYFARGSQLLLDIHALGKSIQAKITEISPMADPESGNFTVKADIPNPNGSIKPGMFVKCRIPKSDVEQVLRIPESALVRRNGDKNSVFCVVNTVAVSKEIVLRVIRDGYAWIDSGISDKDVLVDSPSPFLKEGMNVSAN